MLYETFRGREEWSERYETVDTRGSGVGEDESILSWFFINILSCHSERFDAKIGKGDFRSAHEASVDRQKP